MFDLPTSIVIDDVPHPIRNKGDFRMILDCFDALNDIQLDVEYRVLACLTIFYEELTSESDISQVFSNHADIAVKEMFKFMNCGQDDTVGAKAKSKVVDWDKDSQLIASAINKVANKEIRLEPYVHWWTFMGYYLSIGQSAFATVVSIRSKLKSGKKLEKYEQEFRKDNPQYFIWNSQSASDREADELIRSLWNDGMR